VALDATLSAELFAQQATSNPCSPGGTRAAETSHPPANAAPLRGEIKPNAAESKACRPAITVPPKDVLNILLLMTDDAGFAAPSTFGGVIPTPALDRIAEAGPPYNSFHTTALCSPMSAALLTAHNHHSVGTGVVVDQATGPATTASSCEMPLQSAKSYGRTPTPRPGMAKTTTC